MVVQFFLFWIRAQVTIDDNVHAQHKLLHQINHLWQELLTTKWDLTHGKHPQLPVLESLRKSHDVHPIYRKLFHTELIQVDQHKVPIVHHAKVQLKRCNHVNDRLVNVETLLLIKLKATPQVLGSKQGGVELMELVLL